MLYKCALENTMLQILETNIVLSSRLISNPSNIPVLGRTLNCIHIFIVTGSFLYWCVMRPASQRFFIHSCIYLRILIISYLATFLGTNGLSVPMCRKAVNQSINQPSNKHVYQMTMFRFRYYIHYQCNNCRCVLFRRRLLQTS